MRRRIVSLLLTVAMLVSVLSIGTIGVSATDSSAAATIVTANSTISGVTVSGGSGSFTLTFRVADAVTDATTLVVASAYIGELDVAGVGDDPAGVANDSVGAFCGGNKSATGDAGSKTVEFTVTIPENAAEAGKDYGYGGDEGGEYTIYATTSANSGTNMVATFKLDKNGDLQIPFAVTTTTEAASGTVGTALTNTTLINLTDNVEGGSGSYTYAVKSGSTLPSNLTLENGKITGTPLVAGNHTFTVTITDANDTTATGDVAVTMNVAKGTATAALNKTSATYTGSAQAPTVTVTLPGVTTPVENTDYTVTWDKNGFINADTYTATIALTGTAASNYDLASNSASLTYTINKANRTAPVVTATNATAADATDGKITITSPIAGATYEISTDGTTYTDATVTGGEITGLAAGTYSIRVKADDNYNASPVATATVKAPGVPAAAISDLAKTYTGKPQGATVKVTVEDATGAEQVVDPADYTVSYTGTDGTTYAKSETAPTDAGKYTVSVEKDGKPIGSNTLVIAQAKPGEPELADEIIVDETTLGDVMKNGALKLPGVNNDEVAGTFTWVGDVDDDTMIVPGTKYQWKFDTTNPNYQGLTGEIAWELEDDSRHEAIMLGRANTTLFGPDDNLNRAEAATILSRLYGMYTDEEIFDETKGAAVQHAPTGFADVNDSAIWYYAAVGFAQNKDLIEGKSATSFAPAAKITRAEFVTMLARLVAGTKDVPEVDVSKSKLTGISGHWAENAIVYLELNKGGLNGKVGTDFKPNDNLTRAEAAKMVNAVFGRLQSTSIKEEDQLDADLNLFTDVYRNTWYYNNVIEATVGHEVNDPDFRHVK